MPKPHRRGWLVRRVLVAADVIGLLTAFWLAQATFVGTRPGKFDLLMEAVLFIATLPLWVLVARMYGLYSLDDRRTNHVTTDEVATVFNMVTVCTWVFFAVTWLTGAAHPDVAKLLLFWAFASLCVPLSRALARAYARTRRSYSQNTVIVGAGDVGQTVAEKLLRHPEYGVNLVGFVDAEPKEQRTTVEDLTILGPPDRLAEVDPRLRRRARDHRLLPRLARARACVDPLAEGRVRSGRHRLALLRADRPEHGHQHDRRHPGPLSPAPGARGLRPAPQTRDGHRRVWH